jgi:ubiquinone/menaquinone biosynthesis C-methylase UbiE
MVSNWIFDENKVVGVDYFDESLVSNYDKAHGKFRNFENEAEKIISDLNLTPSSKVLDFGCGTGGLSLPLAKKCGHVFAVDISQAMIDSVAQKAEEQCVKNISPIKSGFLTYQHKGDDLDAIICTVTLHHLPDFWKQVALCRFYEMLKKDGRLFLVDVIFDFLPQEYNVAIEKWLSSMACVVDHDMVQESIIHIKEEYSTWLWIMEGLLERAKFKIDRKIEIMPQMKAFICLKG